MVPHHECGRRFPAKLKVVDYKSYARQVILYGSEALCMKKIEMGILWTERPMVRAMCGVHLKDRKRYKDLFCCWV